MLMIRKATIGLSLLGAWLVASGQVNPANVQVANLRSDLDRLDQQVRSLRIEVEALSRENAQLRTQVTRQLEAGSAAYVTLARFQGTVADLEARIEKANTATKEAIIRQVGGEIEALAKQTQTALAALAKSLDGQPRVSSSVTFSDDYPQSGSTYTVKSGDSLARIARQMGSRVDWIRNANRLANDMIYPGQELFIPLKD